MPSYTQPATWRVVLAMAKICPDCSRMHPGPQARCPAHHLAHTRIDNRRRKRKAVEHGRCTAAWEHTRLARLQLDAYTCQACRGEVCGNRHLTVHLAPELEGNHRDATVDDCITLGAKCHGRIDGRRARRKGGVVPKTRSQQSPVPRLIRTENG